MGAIDVGVGHDDDTFVPQAVGVAILAHSAAEREREVGDFLIGANLVGAGAGDVQYLAADRQDRLRLAVARLLGAAASSEEHKSELQSLMRNPYAVFCLKKKQNTKSYTTPICKYEPLINEH